VRHGENSTRFRDFYDMYLIVSRNKADPQQTVEAMRMTFDLFRCEMPSQALTPPLNKKKKGDPRSPTKATLHRTTRAPRGTHQERIPNAQDSFTAQGPSLPIEPDAGVRRGLAPGTTFYPLGMEPASDILLGAE
jgi:hypothetical protein